ncbi:MAG TPA: outer membrane beta-barrel protein [Allosphingosinicella sp.]|nr:outer membrane beta-barrel protein [Allosphingosinicella sp.]
MNKKLLAAAAAAAFVMIPAAAHAQEGAEAPTGAQPYVGLQVGYHDLGVPSDAAPPLEIDDSALIYGGYAGVDFGSNIVFGVEGNYNLGNGPIDSEYGVAARIGMRADNGTIIFARAGYQWVNLDLEGLTGVANPPAGIDDTVDDWLVGAGVDIATGGRARIRVAVDTITFDSVRPTVGFNFAF